MKYSTVDVGWGMIFRWIAAGGLMVDVLKIDYKLKMYGIYMLKCGKWVPGGVRAQSAM